MCLRFIKSSFTSRKPHILKTESSLFPAGSWPLPVVPPRRTQKMQNLLNDYWRGPYETFGGWFWRILGSSCGIPGLGWLACEHVILVWGSSSKVELTSQSCRFSYQDPHQNPRWHRIIPDRGHHDQHRDNKLFMSQEACVTCLDVRKPLLNIIRFHKT